MKSISRTVDPTFPAHWATIANFCFARTNVYERTDAESLEQMLNLLSARASASDRSDRSDYLTWTTSSEDRDRERLFFISFAVFLTWTAWTTRRREDSRDSSDLPGLHELVDVLVGRQHRLILLQALILASVRAVRVELFALDTVLTVLSGLHVPEEAQHVGVVAAGLPQLVQLPRQLSGHQIRVGRVSCWASVHRTHRVFPAALRVVAKTREHGVQAWQQGRIERIIVGEEERARRNLVEDLRTNNATFLT